jgi:hypothetical protein
VNWCREEQEYMDDSYGILDIKAQLDNGDLIDVEIQIGDRANMHAYIGKKNKNHG